MGKEQKNEKIKKNETIKVVTFPLYVPITIIIGLIIIFFSISKSEEVTMISNVINKTEGIIIEEKTDIQEDFSFAKKILESAKLNENFIKEIEKEIEEKKIEEALKKEESSTQKTNTEKNTNNSSADKIYTASNGEKYKIIGKLSIPSLNIKSDILSATSDALMKIALNKYWGANPNEVGNMVVVGHNYKGSKFFGKLYNIKIGDIVKVTDSKGKTLDYKVYDKYVIDPYDTKCTSQLTNGKTEITLITCYNNGTQRIVVKARA